MEWSLSRSDREQLQRQMQTTHSAREARRLGALLRWDEGEKATAVAQRFGVSRQTLYNWRRKFQATGSPELEDDDRSGRPTVWTPERVDVLEQLLSDAPGDHGFHAVGWTVGLLQKRLKQSLDWEVSDYSLREKLHDLDYVWKRFRYRLAPDPQREKKKTHP